MGYSIYTVVKSKKELQEINEFLNSQSDLINEITTNAYGIRVGYLVDSKELSYKVKSAGQLAIGFDVSRSCFCHYALTAWIAQKVGKTVDDKHYIYYDRERQFLTTNQEDKNNFLVDSNGIAVLKSEGLAALYTNPLVEIDEQLLCIKNLNELNTRYEILKSKKLLDSQVPSKSQSKILSPLKI